MSDEPEYDFYEDSTERDPGLLGFVRREKQFVVLAVAFGLCTLVFSCIDRQFDEMATRAEAGDGQGHAHANPWAKDN